MTLRFLAIVAMIIGAANASIAQPPAALTAQDIDDAIAASLQGDPAPYPLYHLAPIRTSQSAVVAYVYTPYVRVGMAARAARARGEMLTAADVKQAWREPVAYVAFRWYCCVDRAHGTSPADWDPLKPPTDYTIAVPGARIAPGHVTVTPVWVSRDLSLLNDFGGVPDGDVVLIAAYPLDALLTTTDFVIYREWPSSVTQGGKDSAVLTGRVTADDLAHWR